MKKIMVWIILALMIACFASAESFEANYTSPLTGYQTSNGVSNIALTYLRYEPFPVNPGEYFDLWIKAENTGALLTENATFELVPKYPFSLDPNEDAVRQYGLMNREPAVMDYKVRVDKDAVEGDNEIQIRYRKSSIDSWIYKTFDINVESAQTDFDLVIQEASGTETSIAIANTGKNPAYSVIIRIPKQDYYQAAGTSGQMVGNLENGDYTLVGFEIASTARINGDNLKVQIDYTDTLGERRSVIKEVEYNSGVQFAARNSTAAAAGTARFGNGTATTTSIYQTWWFWAIVLACLYIAWKGYQVYERKRESMDGRKR